MPMTAKDAMRLVKQLGWYLDRVKGSHHQFKHATIKGIITIPLHKGDLSPTVENDIKKKAGVK